MNVTTPAHIVEELQTWQTVYHDGLALKTSTFQAPARISNPYDLDLSRFIPNNSAKLEDVFALVSDIVTDAQKRENILMAERVTVVKEYNPDHFPELGDEVIACKLMERKPANLSRDGRGRPNRGFNPMYETAWAKEPNKILYIEARPLDHTLEFSVWAKTSTIADRRALWLERTLIANRWQFTSRGVQPFHFIRRGPDTLWNPPARLHQRGLQFFARLQEFNVIAYPTIREFKLDTSVQHEEYSNGV